MSNNHSVSVVAIDGPSASGKSTVSKRVAQELKFTYVDSGSLYRGMTWKALRESVNIGQPEQVLDLMNRMKLEFYAENRVVLFTIDGEDPGLQLRSEPVRENVADIAAIPGVRAFLVARLQEMVRFGDIVMEGRDIGTVVFPESPFKYYLDADPEERARRRSLELKNMEGVGDVSKVLDSLTRRDKKDSTRKTAPLQIALGAKVINSTSMTIEEVVAQIVAEVRAALGT
ncbi:MAG TPA: (d)CMP kinase [Kiritimatiellia bacterium]|nr:(d)CMP kinase [Kiritimatiellia bacterium]HRZ13269.1 (d)CMP kinase [Kiritimatiellia bacterium]HSA18718.1 (d)CMP kinase [Kiritimatiellia bacterium]